MINIRKLLLLIKLTMVECSCVSTCHNILVYSRSIMNQVNENYNMLYSIRRDVDKMVNLSPPPIFPYPPVEPPLPFGPPSLPPNTPPLYQSKMIIMYILIIIIIVIVMVVIIIRSRPYNLCCYIKQNSKRTNTTIDMI